MRDLPLISVIIPAHNAGPFIQETLRSVTRQTYPRWELIVVDDGSTDDTPQRIQPFLSILRYIRQENAGGGAARNRGLSVASGEYIAFLDHDDLWSPEKLEVQVAVASRHPRSGLIACDGILFDREKILSPRLLSGSLADLLDQSPEGEIEGHCYHELVQYNAIASPSQTLIPRRVIESVGPMTTRRAEAADYEYYLRIALLGPITLHHHSLVSRRYLPTSTLGPLSRRRFEGILLSVPILRRHQRLCAVEDRSLVRSILRRWVREIALEAFRYARKSDGAYARHYLSRLFRAAPWEPRTAAYWLALWLPTPVLNRLVMSRRWLLLLRQHASGSRHVPGPP